MNRKASDKTSDRAMRDYRINTGRDGVIQIRQGQVIPKKLLKRWRAALVADKILPGDKQDEQK